MTITSLRFRVVGGFAVVLALFLVLIVGHFVFTERQHADDHARLQQVGALRTANQAVLQHLTDAETGVRGFQLTGEPAFLEPYTSGRVAAFTAFDEAAALAGDRDTRRLLQIERQAAEQWLYGYAIPIVNAGTADTDAGRAARGKEMFDRVRTTNADVAAAIDDYAAGAMAQDSDDGRRATLFSAVFALLVVLAGLGYATLLQRHLVVPLEYVRQTLRRLADGDLAARAVPSGPPELRAVMTTLNDLAAETERLITAEQARAAHSELRKAVVAELRTGADPVEAARRIAALVGAAIGADAVYGRACLEPGDPVDVRWPATADDLDPAVEEEVRAAVRGAVVTPAAVPGALAMALGGDAGCPPGLICVRRIGGAPWQPEERRLLVTLGREIDHVTRQERLRRRQARLIDELRMLDEQKDAFVATVTHELRTPLASILGYSELLLDADGLAPGQRRGLDAILRNARRLHATVEDLLLLDRSGRKGAEHVPVDLADVVETLDGTLGPTARAKDLGWQVRAEPARVSGDADELERALRNLLANAIKFTDPGGRVECRLAAAGDAVVVTVRDTGIGIPADDLPGLFTPFHRAANAVTQAVQGTGLGLAIVRDIVTEHGGTVTVRSEEGRGSTFTVTLPALAAGVSPSPPLAVPSRSGRG